jgi:ABC-2 type transport system permease protein
MISETLALTRRSLKKWIRNPFAVIVTIIQSIFWLALFGNSFNPANAISSSTGGGSLGPLQQAFGGAANYITFLTPGVISIIALTGMSFMGVDLVLDRINGYLNVVSTYPIRRSSIYFGGVVQNMAKAMVQIPVTFLLALVVPNGLRLAQGFGILNLLGVFTAIALLTVVFSTLFTGIALSVKSTDSFFGLVNFLTFPIMFTSTAFFPISFFPDWLKPIAQANPISMASAAARVLLMNGTLSAAQLSALAGDLAGLSVFIILFAILGTLMARNALKAR